VVGRGEECHIPVGHSTTPNGDAVVVAVEHDGGVGSIALLTGGLRRWSCLNSENVTNRSTIRTPQFTGDAVSPPNSRSLLAGAERIYPAKQALHQSLNDDEYFAARRSRRILAKYWNLTRSLRYRKTGCFHDLSPSINSPVSPSDRSMIVFSSGTDLSSSESGLSTFSAATPACIMALCAVFI